MSPLVLGGMLEVSVNTLSAGGKYFVQDCQNFPLPIQEQLSEKGKSFSQFFVSFPESTSYLKDFLEKDDYNSLCVSKSTDCEKLAHTTLQESAVSEHALTVNTQKRPKYLRNLHQSTFITFFRHSQGS